MVVVDAINPVFGRFIGHRGSNSIEGGSCLMMGTHLSLIFGSPLIVFPISRFFFVVVGGYGHGSPEGREWLSAQLNKLTMQLSLVRALKGMIEDRQISHNHRLI